MEKGGGGGKWAHIRPQVYLLLFTSNTYPSKPKIDGVTSAKNYEKNTKFISSLQECDWMRK